jgi:hypothetical protein
MFVAEVVAVSRHPIDKESVECIADWDIVCSYWSLKQDRLEKEVFLEESPKYSWIPLDVDTSEVGLIANAE